MRRRCLHLPFYSEGCSTANRAEHAFLAGELLRPCHRIGACDRPDLVIEALVDRFLQDVRDEVRRPALDRVRFEGRMARRRCTGGIALLDLTAAEELRVRGLAEDDLHFRSLAAQDATDAGDGAARAVAGDEVVEPRACEI